MLLDLNNLPIDTELLHRIITDLSAEVSSLSDKIESLKNQLALLKAKRFGKSSEKLDKEIADLELKIEEEEEKNCNQVIDANDANKSDQTKEKNQPKRLPLPPHLPRIDKILNPNPICPKCGSEEFHKISDDISETLDYIPASFKVIKTIRPRCACKNCENIVQADIPDKPIAKGKAEAGLLAHILVQKYCNHLPYYRQSEIYEREENIILSRSTMASWGGQCSRLLDLIVDEIRQEVFNSDHIHGDDTIVKVLAPGLGKTKTGRLWVYARDGRNYGSNIPPAICYFYSPDRKGERPLQHLKDYHGVFTADAYPGYDRLYIDKDNKNIEAAITEAACWAHTRRKFYEITVTNDKANIALEILTRIAQIYKIEDDVRGHFPDKRLNHRRQKSKPLIDDLFKRLNYLKNKLPGKSSTAKAINYTLNHQIALSRFLDDGKIEIDNNAAENAMRPIALGRKNWLFAGSDNGGNTAANIYSITETCKINKINPYKYLHKVLSVIQGYKVKDIAELLPWNVKFD
jgi:transposase